MISDREMELIAALKSDPAYQLLLDKIQATIDSMTAKLLVTFDKEELDRQIPLWQSFHSILTDLRETPEQFAQEIGYNEVDDANKIEDQQTQQLKDHLKEINKDRVKLKEFGWRPMKNKNKFNL